MCSLEISMKIISFRLSMKFTMFQIKLRRKVKMIYNLKQKNTEKDNFWNVLLEKVQERVQFSEDPDKITWKCCSSALTAPLTAR